LLGRDWDGFECGATPWSVVSLGAFAAGIVLLLAGLILLLSRRTRTAGWTALAGVLTAAAALVVFAIVAAHDYHLCSS